MSSIGSVGASTTGSITEDPLNAFAMSGERLAEWTSVVDELMVLVRQRAVDNRVTIVMADG